MDRSKTAKGSIEAALGGACVIAVLSPTTPEDAVFAARALAAGGIQAVEVAFRTDAAEAALAAVANALPDLPVGAGTVTTPGQVAAAKAAGARFVVCPASTWRWWPPPPTRASRACRGWRHRAR